MISKWMSAVALAAAGAMIAGPALAQGGSTTTPQTGDTKSSTSGSSASSDQSTSGSSTGSMSGASDMKGDRRAAGGGAGSEQVKQIQQALKDKGMDPGDVDGKMGPKTRAALRDFQKQNGLKETGRPDAETMAKLGVEGKSSSSAESSASPSASPKSDTSSSPSASSPSSSSSSSSVPSATTPSGDTSKSGTGSSKTETTPKTDNTKK